MYHRTTKQKIVPLFSKWYVNFPLTIFFFPFTLEWDIICVWKHSSAGMSARLTSGRSRVRAPLLPLWRQFRGGVRFRPYRRCPVSHIYYPENTRRLEPFQAFSLPLRLAEYQKIHKTGWSCKNSGRDACRKSSAGAPP